MNGGAGGAAEAIDNITHPNSISEVENDVSWRSCQDEEHLNFWLPVENSSGFVLFNVVNFAMAGSFRYKQHNKSPGLHVIPSIVNQTSKNKKEIS